MKDAMRQAVSRLALFFRRKQLDRELDAEVTAHLDFAIEENIQRGMSVEDARRNALLRLGGLGSYCRAGWVG